FLRRNFMKNKRTRVTGEWRKPRGLHNKLRRRRRGVGQWVMPGYRMPKAVRGMTTEGLLPTVVETVEQLKSLKADMHLLILKSGTGTKNRIEMVKEAVKHTFKIANVKDPAAWLKQIEEEISQRKKAKKGKEKKQEAPAEKAAEKTKEKKEEKTDKTDAEKVTKEEIKEQEKILTRKE
ncbi:MAG: eL32 family ribosomal protein, partial [Nanoarchaeota archaeon]